MNMIPVTYIKLFAIDMAIQWIGCLIAIALKTEKFYDLTGKVLIFVLFQPWFISFFYFTGSFTFILLSYLSFEWSKGTQRQFIQSHMVMAWAGR